tara:strand:- start:586 stop:756 length:171 start_codon:yes stop_codon:yes gene_type:complete
MTLIESALCPADLPPKEQTGSAICFECDYRWEPEEGNRNCPECGGPAEFLDTRSSE